MITIKEGDLLKAEETIIGHQVNCMGAAGGLAAAVFKKYPHAKRDYQQMIARAERGNYATMLGMTYLTGQQKDGHIIANIYGQYYPGADYRPKALRNALEMLAGQAKQLNVSVALPWRLSCGICGGDWGEVYQIIKETMKDVNCTIYRRKGDR